MKKQDILILFSVFVVSLSFLMYETLLTRVTRIFFGSTFNNSFIISLAVLGLGLGAIIAGYLFKIKDKTHLFNVLAWLLVFYSLFLYFPLMLLHTNFASIHFNLAEVFYFLLIFIVYTLVGMILSLVFANFKEKASFLYFSSTLGSALGSFLIIFFLDIFSIEKLIILIIFFSILSIAPLLFLINFPKNLFFGFLLFFFLVFLINSIPSGLNCISGERTLSGPLNLSDSNSFSYVQAYKPTDFLYILNIDCFFYTTAIKYSNESLFNSRIIETLRNPIFSFPYSFREYNSVLVLGSGGGIDVARAVYGKSKNVTAVEINPLLANVASFVTGEDNIYTKDNVDLKVMEARNFVLGTNETYDLIDLSTAKRYGTLGMKSFIFLENYLFTEEAFSSYLDHLNEDGILFLGDRKQFLDIHSNVMINVLVKKGIDPLKSMILIDANPEEFGDAGLFIKKNGFSQEELDLIGAQAKSKGVSLVLVNQTILDQLESMPHITDDRPFFWFMEHVILLKNSSWSANDHHFVTFGTLLFVFSIFLLVLLFSVLLKIKYLKQREFRNNLFYFLFIGLGYMLIEINFINKFTIFLINPVHTLSIILTGFLFFGAMGGLISSKISDGESRKYAKIISFLIFVYLLFFVLIVDTVFKYTLASSEFVKIICTLSLLAVPSFLMGFLFPLGIKNLSEFQSKDIPYFIGINSIACVLGGFIAFLFSLFFGFKPTFVLGSGIYLLVLLLTFGTKK